MVDFKKGLKKGEKAEQEETSVAIATRPAESQLSTTAIPEHLKKYASLGSLGTEQMTKDDFIMPRLAIAQAMSPQVTKGDPLFLKGLEVGNFFNTLTGEIYGDGPVLVVPLFSFKSRIYFPPRGSDEAILCATSKVVEGRLVEGRITPEGCDICPHSKFLDEPRPDGSTRPNCTLFYNYVVVLPQEGGVMAPLALSLKSKMIKSAKKWNSLIRYRQLPAFVQMFNIRSVAEKAPKGTFFNLAIDNAGQEISPELVAQTEKLFSTWSNQSVKFDTRGVDREEDEEFSGREVGPDM